MIGATQQDYSMLSDPQLKQAMLFAQRSNNTPEFLQLMAEANKRKQMRSEAQGMQAGQQAASQPPSTTADQVMSGIANLSSGEHEYAGGGIVAFADGGAPGIKYGNYTALPYQSEKILPNQTGYEGQGLLEFLQNVTGKAYRSVADFLENGPGSYNSRQGLVKGAAVGQPGAVTDARRADNAIDAAAAAQAPTSWGSENTRGPISYGPAASAAPPARSGQGIRATATAPINPTAPAAEPTPEWMKAPDARTLDQIIADRKKASAEGEEGIKSLMDPYTKKLEERRKKVEGETAASEGILGLKADWFGDDKRKALRDFGFALMAGKDPNAMVNIGAAGKAAGDAYEAAKEKRQARLDALDERDQKLAMARYEMSRGNRDEAAKLVKEADEAGQTAFKNRFEIGKFGQETKDKAEDRAFREKQLKQQYELGIGQIAASKSAAGRNPQLELYTALGGGDPKKGYEFAQAARGESAADMATWRAYASDPTKLAQLKTDNPVLYAQVLAKIQSQLGGAATGTADGPVRNR